MLRVVAELIGANQLVGPILSQSIECTVGPNRAQAVCLAVGVGVVDDALYAVGNWSGELCCCSWRRGKVWRRRRKVRAFKVARGT